MQRSCTWKRWSHQKISKPSHTRTTDRFGAANPGMNPHEPIPKTGNPKRAKNQPTPGPPLGWVKRGIAFRQSCTTTFFTVDRRSTRSWKMVRPDLRSDQKLPSIWQRSTSCWIISTGPPWSLPPVRTTVVDQQMLEYLELYPLEPEPWHWWEHLSQEGSLTSASAELLPPGSLQPEPSSHWTSSCRAGQRTLQAWCWPKISCSCDLALLHLDLGPPHVHELLHEHLPHWPCSEPWCRAHDLLCFGSSSHLLQLDHDLLGDLGTPGARLVK